MSIHGHTTKRFWIIDTGATTNDPSQLISINSQTQSSILTANGGVTCVTCERTAKVSQFMNLNTILVVPSLYSSLLSVS